MTAWKFVGSDEDGRVWMRNPTETHAFIDFRTHTGASTEEWRRIMVVTKGWVERQLSQSERAVFSAMLVVPDETPMALQSSIDDAVAGGGLGHFASPVD